MMIRRIIVFLLLSVTFLGRRHACNGAPFPHGYFEAQRARVIGRLERRGNLDVDPSQDLAYCHLAGYLAFSQAVDTECNLKQATKIYRELAAVYMAIYHFNNGNGIVVPAVNGIDQRCPIRLTAELIDSKYTPAIPVQSLTQIMGSRETSTTAQGPVPCAVVGARTSSATGPGAVVSGVYSLPHMSYTATSPELNDAFRYPLFSRVVTSDDAAAKAGLRFLTQVQDSSHVAVLYINDPFGIEYNKAFLNEALENNVTVQSFPLEFPPDSANIKQAIQKVKDSGYRHIFLIVFSSFIEEIMLEAQSQGITGPEYSYLLGISTSFFDDAQYSPEKAKAFEGMGILPEFGAQPRTAGYERFVKVWNQLGPEDVDYFNTKLPLIAGKDGSECFQAEADFFDNTNFNTPGDTAPFAYDTIMALGLGACAAWNEAGLLGEEHASAIVSKARFEGATGFIQMDADTRARDPLSFSYAILNVCSQKGKDGSVSFTTHESYYIRPNEDRTDWEIEQTGEFFYNDKSKVPPPALPELVFDYNQIGKWRSFGLSLCGIVMAASIGLAAWSWANRKSRAVSLSQPPFLIMICVGTLITGSMLIPLSIDDEHYGGTATDAACMAQPWLASVGFVTVFSALYSKTSRIYQIMQNAERFRSVKVSERDVLVPFFILLSANLVVLFCWTFIDPLQYVRTPDTLTDEWNRVISSTGRCKSDSEHGAGPYLLCLAAVNLGAVVLANIQAYKARNISDDMSESKYIGLIMMCLLQTWLTGGPLLFLVYDNPVNNYVVVSMICFLTCMAVLSLIFIPKMMLWRDWETGRVNRSMTTTSQSGARRGGSILRGSGISGLNIDSAMSNMSLVSQEFRHEKPSSVIQTSTRSNIKSLKLESVTEKDKSSGDSVRFESSLADKDSAVDLSKLESAKDKIEATGDLNKAESSVREERV